MMIERLTSGEAAVSVVYIGNKKIKRDTVCHSGIEFPPMIPVPVPLTIAVKLLKHRGVWRRADEVEALENERREAAELAAMREEEEAERQRMQEEEDNFYFDGIGDLAKMTGPQLATQAESLELDIEPKGAQERVDEFRLRVRDAIKVKRGE
jgi:hypothetical protein